MKRWTGIIGGLLIGTVAGGFLVGPWIHGQQAEKSKIIMPKELTSYRAVVKHVLPAVVSIDAESKQTVAVPNKNGGPNPFDNSQIPPEFRRFFEDFDVPEFSFPKSVPSRGFGSGFVIDPDGVIMTNYHVVKNASKVTVQFVDGAKYESTDVRGDRKTDLAIIMIDTKGKKLPYLELGNSDQMEIGDRVLAFGSPFGLTGTVTQGIVSAKGRNGLHMNMYEDFLQTDAAINPGNSGGPLVNLEGKVIGINAAIKSKSGGFNGVGLAVASNLAVRVKDDLVKHGTVHRGYLGVQVVDLDAAVADRFGIEKNTGVVVGSIFKNTPASKSGLKAGDIITSIGGKAVQSGKMLQDIVQDLPTDKSVNVEIVRDGKKQTLPVTIEQLPDTFGEVGAPALQTPQGNNEGVALESLGIEVANLSPQLAQKHGYDANASGVIITEVTPNSLAYSGGLRSGMLIRQIDKNRVSNVEQAANAMNNASLQKGVLLQIQSPQGGINYILLRSSV